MQQLPPSVAARSDANAENTIHFVPSSIAKLAVYCGALGILVSFLYATLQSAVFPIPDMSIDEWANHYPQFIYYRIFEISSAWVLGALWVFGYWWLETQNEFVMIKLFYPSLVYLLGTLATLALLVSIATIDTGKMNHPLHNESTFLFYVLEALTMVVYLINVARLRNQKNDVVSSSSYSKKVYATFFIVLFTFSLAYATPVNIRNISGYFITFLIYLYAWTLREDFQGYEIQFELLQGFKIVRPQ